MLLGKDLITLAFVPGFHISARREGSGASPTPRRDCTAWRGLSRAASFGSWEGRPAGLFSSPLGLAANSLGLVLAKRAPWAAARLVDLVVWGLGCRVQGIGNRGCMGLQTAWRGKVL